MKKFLSIILCVLMLIPCFTLGAFAEEEEASSEWENIALNSALKVSSQMNSSSPGKATMNGRIESDFGGGHENYWSPNFPSHGGDGDLSTDLQYIQYTFKGQNKGYKIIDKVELYVANFSGHNDNKNNITYTALALINGIWTEVASARCYDFDYYPCTVGGSPSTAYTKIVLEVPETVVVDGDVCQVNTTTLKIECTDFGKNGCGHDWDVPRIYETVITGKTGFIPEIDLHAGALLSTNAALSGHMSASSSSNATYPYLAADNLTTTSWISKNTTNGEWIMAEFDKAYDIEALSLNFSGIVLDANDEAATYDYSVEVEFRINGTWKSVGEADVTTSPEANQPNVTIDIGSGETGVEALRVTFYETNGVQASVSEINATIANGKKCEFLFEYLTVNRKQSIASGNIAIYGEPYASSYFDHLGITDVSYINDGAISYFDSSWYAKSFEMGQYAGVTLEKEFSVNKVTLYFNDIITADTWTGYFSLPEDKILGDYILGIDVQAKIDGEYQTVASGSSYNADAKEYVVSFEFDAVTTDDIRVLFTDTDAGFAYIKEIEIYTDDSAYVGFDNYPQTRRVLSSTSNFGTPDIVERASFMKRFDPIELMFIDIVDIKASLWI